MNRHEVIQLLKAAAIDKHRIAFALAYGSGLRVNELVHVQTSGAVIDANDIKTLLAKDEIKYLAEMMNYPGVLHEDEEHGKQQVKISMQQAKRQAVQKVAQMQEQERMQVAVRMTKTCKMLNSKKSRGRYHFFYCIRFLYFIRFDNSSINLYYGSFTIDSLTTKERTEDSRRLRHDGGKGRDGGEGHDGGGEDLGDGGHGRGGSQSPGLGVMMIRCPHHSHQHIEHRAGWRMGTTDDCTM
eukprot:snap_masked-scaffold328_size205007-processed-gene-1.4 protein:Tk09623 transcript:snap_masked-scaffold328_size205007-processed-gene-1.4-mRNA-1 annotation:"adenine deaminase"